MNKHYFPNYLNGCQLLVPNHSNQCRPYAFTNFRIKYSNNMFVFNHVVYIWLRFIFCHLPNENLTNILCNAAPETGCSHTGERVVWDKFLDTLLALHSPYHWILLNILIAHRFKNGSNHCNGQFCPFPPFTISYLDCARRRLVCVWEIIPWCVRFQGHVIELIDRLCSCLWTPLLFFIWDCKMKCDEFL